jgi:trans-2,3-dihydro-3-hydroxyanthranilate isomerase
MLSYSVLDVFTSQPLQGNQLAVFTDGRGLDKDEMQGLARELNLSETVFLMPPEGEGDVRVRIFTPSVELPFAGHPVLGTAFVVAEALGTNAVSLETGRGIVPIDLVREGNRIAFGRMSQPIPTAAPFEQPEALLAALGVEGSELPIEIYDNGVRHVYVVVASTSTVASVTPDFTALASLGEMGVNCAARAGTDWKTRMFGPGVGVNEDPATGSAAGPLAVHLARHGLIKFSEEIRIQQGAEIRRPSVLHATVHGSAEEITRVEVGGSAVLVAQGHYLARSARSD